MCWCARTVASWSEMVCTEAPCEQITLSTIVSAYSAALFVYMTSEIDRLGRANQVGEIYSLFRQPWVIWTEFVVALILLIDYLIAFVLAKSKISFALNGFQFSAVLAAVPGIIGPAIGFFYYGFQFLRFIAAYKSLRSLKRTGWKPMSSVIVDVALVILTALSLLLSISGFFFVYENKYLNTPNSFGVEPKIDSYFTSIYFICITLATVGYGDYSPVTTSGKLAIIIGIISSFFILPAQISTVADKLAQWRSAKKYSGDRHVILYSDNDAVFAFIKSFYRARTRVASNLLLMTPDKLSESVFKKLQAPFYKIRVASFKGSISDDVDATRARTGSAEACFILANKFPKDAEQEDAEAVVSAISARNFRKTLPVFIQINQSIHKLAIPSHIKEIICMQDLREALLVQNCIAPGFLTVVHNLLSAFPPKEAKRKPIWLAEFTYGKSHQLETTVDLTALRDISFYDAVDGIYRHYSALLIGIASPSQRGVQILPPRSYKIQYGDKGIFIWNLGRRNLDACVTSPVLLHHVKTFRQPGSAPPPSAAADANNAARAEYGMAREEDPYENVQAGEESDDDRHSSDDEAHQAPVKAHKKLQDSKSRSSHSRHSSQQHPEARWDFESCSRRSVEQKVKNHIVVAGPCDEVTLSICSRLVKKLSGSRDLVILLSKDSAQSNTLVMGMFRTRFSHLPRLHFLIGEQVDPVDLRRAGAGTADVVLALPNALSLHTEELRAAQDANALITWHLLKQSPAFSVIELLHPPNSALLGTEEMASKRFGFYFARGSIFVREIFDLLLAQSYYKPAIIKVVEELLATKANHISVRSIYDDLIKHAKEASAQEKALGRAEDSSFANSSSLDLTGNKPTFAHLVSFLLFSKGILPLALYRVAKDGSDADEEEQESQSNRNRQSMEIASPSTGILNLPRRLMNSAKWAGAASKSKKGRKAASEDTSSTKRYVFTVPSKETTLRKSDMIIVISTS
eukprot:TRINITY_DN2134_c0_g1_i2.p1 TRINITY_DN2134_c0_g1~~TRINITY_DN2134_c0_g1_i2.p1  ORF type:complete len:973 (+),score=172.29 TRINITY_DN2134_c0_g1_i2:2295-5213(+)